VEHRRSFGLKGFRQSDDSGSLADAQKYTGRPANCVGDHQGERGVFYAAQVGPLARDEANQLCETLKSAGGSCYIQRN
jgi:cell division septation protein DedD